MSSIDLEKLQPQLRKIQSKIDTYMDEIKEGSEEVRKAASDDIGTLSGYYDRWEAMRSDMSMVRIRTVRLASQAKDDYLTKLTLARSKGLRGRDDHGAFEERDSVHKTRLLGEFKTMRVLEQIEEELEQFFFLVNNKMKWVEEKRREIRYKRDQQRFDSKQNYIN